MTEQQAAEELGFTPDRMRPCQSAPSLDVANERLEALKDEARRRYHQLALELHPDRTGGCEEKAARFRVLTAAWQQIKGLQMRLPPPVQRVVISFNSWSGTSTSTTGSWGGGW